MAILAAAAVATAAKLTWDAMRRSGPTPMPAAAQPTVVPMGGLVAPTGPPLGWTGTWGLELPR